MILTVTPNPSIDRSLVVPGYRLGAIHRPQRLVTVAGGKGVNVARTIKRLGGDAQACIILAGHNGRWIMDQLNLEGIPAQVTWAASVTRVCTGIIDPQSRQLPQMCDFMIPVYGHGFRADMLMRPGILVRHIHQQ